MQLPSVILNESTPIRARVAFTLAVADRLLPVLRGNDLAYQAAEIALADAWRWDSMDAEATAESHERNVEELIDAELSVRGNEAAANAVLAATSAFFYATWYAYDKEVRRKKIQWANVSNDMSDVDEDVIDEVCEYAKKTGRCDEAWIRATLDRLVRDFGAADPTKLGRRVSRKYFADPPAD